MSKILLIGGSSLLGRALLQTAPPEHQVEATYDTHAVQAARWRMNITVPRQVQQVFDGVRPEVVVHAASDGRVDFVEQNLLASVKVNAEGTWNVRQAAAAIGAKLVFFSSNAVFSGTQPPYREESTCDPINLYGALKKQADNLVMTTERWLIIRPFLLYGWPWPTGRENWATRVIKALRRGEELSLVDDVWWQPTYATDCAAAVWKLLGLRVNNEIFHVAAQERVTLYQFGQAVARVFNLDGKLLRPVPTSHFKDQAPRPRDTCFELAKIDQLGIQMADIHDGLQQMKKEEAT